MWQELAVELQKGDIKALARAISLIENLTPGYEEFLKTLPASKTKLTGITGPPGAGKSTLVDGLIGEIVKQDQRVAVICVDPSSPFNRGAVLGDRIRMSEWYTHPNVFIRSLATRGSLGGLHPMIIEIADVMKAAGFDQVIIETVGVGQSEVEIVGLADTTVVVVVPEAGDEVQTMKAGLMEIADIFVVNKSDRPEADLFVKNLRSMLAPAFSNHDKMVPVLKTTASQKNGISELFQEVLNHQSIDVTNEKAAWLLTERVMHIVAKRKMQNVREDEVRSKIETAMKQNDFNIYRFAETIS